MTRVGIVGAGIMGRGIAEVCASHGHEVTIVESSETQLDAALEAIRSHLSRETERGRLTEERYQRAISRLKGSLEIAGLRSCEVVIEAVIEDPVAKQNVFEALGSICNPEAVIASNTSSLSLSQLAAASGHPDQVIGLHFFNPPTALHLVEVVSSESTSRDTIERAMLFCDSIDRLTVRVKDTPGFIVNRLLVPFIFDAIRMLENGTATPEDIDQACKTGLSHRMGPLATADLIGLDTLMNISESMFEEYGEPRFKSPTNLRRMVALGQLGRKSRRGFYDYSEQTVATGS